MADNINLGREQFGDLKHRKNVRNLSDEELADLRRAFAGVYEISDNRGYQYFAGLHGLPLPYYCEHGNMLFLPWHRAYLYALEKALQEIVEGVTLPYWDWTSDRSIHSGIPRAYREGRTPDGAPNPLRSAAIMYPDDPDWMTRREPRRPRELERYRNDVDEAMETDNFHVFSRALEQAHGAVHGWVGGDMSTINFAAYDPIFWAHHAFIDKLWADWQRTHPDASTPRLDDVLVPFNMTVESTVNWRLNLGYDYVADEVFETWAAGETEVGVTNFNNSNSQVTLPHHEKDFDSAVIEFHNVHPPKGSYEARVFINDADADEETDVYDNPNYAGSFYFFGHAKKCSGDKGHCDMPKPQKKFDIRPPHHLTPYKLYKNVTKCLQDVGKDEANVYVKMVCVDRYGERLENQFKCEGMSLVYRD